VSVESLVYEKGLPASLDCERFVLGSVMLNDGLFAEVAAMLPAEAFSMEKHRRIFTRMTELAKRDERIDRLTVANELIVQGQIESIDGMGYLVSLDEGIPELPNIESYTRIIREKYDKRRAIFACQRAINQLLIGEDETPKRIGRYGSKHGAANLADDVMIWSPTMRDEQLWSDINNKTPVGRFTCGSCGGKFAARFVADRGNGEGMLSGERCPFCDHGGNGTVTYDTLHGGTGDPALSGISEPPDSNE
jgi:hypothetical protein